MFCFFPRTELYLYMLPCVCSVIDQRWRQNVVRIKEGHTKRYSRVCHWCSVQNLFQLLESRPLPTHEKRAIWRNLLSIQNEAMSLVAMHAEQGIVIGQEKSRHCQTWFKWLLVEWKLTAKAELNCQIYKCKESAGKIKSVYVIRATLWAEKLECFLEYCWSWKNTLGKRAVAVTTGRHLIRV